MPPKKEEPLKEILPRSGLVYSEKSSLIEVMCKPRIMPIKSQTLERLESLEERAAAKLKPAPFHGNAPPGSSYGSGAIQTSNDSQSAPPIQRPTSALGARRPM